ncbi:saccharopine dehydrogenase NADP-binding domain-containing protein [Phytomonospora endophytica]|uniref:Short subunit dehydrogenase-like uncharacterized protein n=1 Tax=Phytomonospora endophytica TaxID=714109 RepID=A0A841FR23_9ACTN|nr:saccharopine dehydrogenase NADP-binding domain-containing protein [Phytomonospora endophytica]MBB6036002.1 short subunit dehydrogenase-like uncharacterized protein [Phytomonospora endophytica]GIG66908.1 saccharopine dehydrogenase [Phytomonospora endophytica]
MKIAVYGASGHVGRFAVEELRRRDIPTVLVGRDAGRLRAAAERAGVPDPEIRVAGSHDHDALVAAFTGVDAVVSSLPDYTGNGEGVVRAAIAAGAHYVDVAGEQLFVRKIYDEYGDAAAAAGVTLVPAVTEAGVFADLLAHVAAERLGGADEIVLSHVASGAGSRGSMLTVFNNLDTFLSGGLSYADGEFHSGPTARRAEFELPDGETVTVSKFPQPGVVSIPRHTKTGAVEGVLATAILDVVKDVSEADLAAAPETPDVPAAYRMVVDTYRDGRRLRGIGSGPDTYLNSGQMSVDVAVRLASGEGRTGARATAELFEPAAFLDGLAKYGMTWTLTG